MPHAQWAKTSSHWFGAVVSIKAIRYKITSRRRRFLTGNLLICDPAGPKYSCRTRTARLMGGNGGKTKAILCQWLGNGSGVEEQMFDQMRFREFFLALFETMINVTFRVMAAFLGGTKCVNNVRQIFCRFLSLNSLNLAHFLNFKMFHCAQKVGSNLFFPACIYVWLSFCICLLAEYLFD